MQPLHFNAIYIAADTGIEPAISAVTVQHVTYNTSQPKYLSVPSCQICHSRLCYRGATENQFHHSPKLKYNIQAQTLVHRLAYKPKLTSLKLPYENYILVH